jgi:hypothetical protein
LPGTWPTGTTVAAIDGHAIGHNEAKTALEMGPGFGDEYYLVAVGLAPNQRALVIAEEVLVLGFGSLSAFILTDRIVKNRVPV